MNMKHGRPTYETKQNRISDYESECYRAFMVPRHLQIARGGKRGKTPTEQEADSVVLLLGLHGGGAG